MQTRMNKQIENPTVFLVDDDPSLLKALRWLMISMDYNVEAYSSARDYLNAVDLSKPGCVVMDVRMPEISGVELHELILKRSGKIPVIFISGYSDVPLVVERLKRGAIDFLTKPINNNKLLDSVNRAFHISASYLEKEKIRKQSMLLINRLSSNELQIMRLSASGVSSEQISKQLAISVSAVEASQADILSKTHVESIVELADLAYKANLIERKND